MSEKSFWDLGVSSCLYGNFDDEFLKQLQQNDIHYAEISGGRNSFFKDIDFVKNADKIFKNALTYEVTINSIHLPFVPPSEVDFKQADGEIYNNTMKIYTALIKASANAGIKYAVIHSGLGVKPEQDRNEVYNIVCSNLKKLCEISKEAGIKLAIENLKPAAIGGTKEEIYSLINEIDDLGVCFDTNHSLNQTNEDFIRLIKDRIVTLHVSDYDFVDEQHWLPLCGKINWKSIIDELKKVGYNGIFTYEVPSKDVVTVADIKDNYIKLRNL